MKMKGKQNTLALQKNEAGEEIMYVRIQNTGNMMLD